MKLATTGMERTEAEKKIEETKLLAMRRQEITDKIEKIKKYSGSRYVIHLTKKKKLIYYFFLNLYFKGVLIFIISLCCGKKILRF